MPGLPGHLIAGHRVTAVAVVPQQQPSGHTHLATVVPISFSFVFVTKRMTLQSLQLSGFHPAVGGQEPPVQ